MGAVMFKQSSFAAVRSLSHINIEDALTAGATIYRDRGKKWAGQR